MRLGIAESQASLAVSRARHLAECERSGITNPILGSPSMLVSDEGSRFANEPDRLLVTAAQIRTEDRIERLRRIEKFDPVAAVQRLRSEHQLAVWTAYQRSIESQMILESRHANFVARLNGVSAREPIRFVSETSTGDAVASAIEYLDGLAQNRSAVELADANCKRLRWDFDAIETLHRQGIASWDERARLNRDLEIARADRRYAEEQLEIAKLRSQLAREAQEAIRHESKQLRKVAITAPRDVARSKNRVVQQVNVARTSFETTFLVRSKWLKETARLGRAASRGAVMATMKAATIYRKLIKTHLSRRNMKLPTIVMTGLLLTASAVGASEPIYSLDAIGNHPYRFVPYYGHASQNPGSPKHFVPGYGYRIPGFGTAVVSLVAPGSYQGSNAWGRREHATYRDEDFQNWTNSLGGPWYHPGWPGNVRLRTQAW